QRAVPDGADGTGAHAARPVRGAGRNCGGSPVEAAVCAAALALHSKRMVEQANAVVVPSAFALERLRTLGAPVEHAHVLPHVMRAFAPTSRADRGTYALIAARLVRGKGLDVAVAACRQAGIELVVAGDR